MSVWITSCCEENVLKWTIPWCSNTQYSFESKGSKEACQKLAAPIRKQVLGMCLLVLQWTEQLTGPSELGDGDVRQQLVLTMLPPIHR